MLSLEKMEEELIQIKNTALSFIMEANDLESLEETRAQFLGKNGKLTNTLKEIAKLPKEKRPEIGVLANDVKNAIEEAIKHKQESLTNTKRVTIQKKLDVTEAGIRPPLGHLHLVTQAIEEITRIFEKIGFERVRYPEIDWDYYAFTALNFPKNHPARDDWETFFIQQDSDSKFGPVVLTPHTSNGQVREMEKIVARQKKNGEEINIKMLNIAKTYRRQSDVSHTPMFHQFETLCVGKNISIADLKGTLDFFAKSYFGQNRKTRIRPYHFQFTEPSFEVDITCGVCSGAGCKLCKEGWLEVGGAGMVHPNVLRYGGIDPKKYSGFASGFGVERVLMMKEGIQIDDLRLLYSNKLEFLEQF